MAMILLLVAAVSSLSQGMSLVLCRCSGHVFVGAAPESCCDACPEAAEDFAEASLSVVSPAGSPIICSLGNGECFATFAHKGDTYLPSGAREELHAPDMAATAILCPPWEQILTRPPPEVARHQEALLSPEPPGRPRTLLYGSLQI